MSGRLWRRCLLNNALSVALNRVNESPNEATGRNLPGKVASGRRQRFFILSTLTLSWVLTLESFYDSIIYYSTLL
jgi:hypothetical protein